MECYNTTVFFFNHDWNFKVRIASQETSDVPKSFLSSSRRVRVTSPSSQIHLKFSRVESMSSHDLLESSQTRFTRTVESLGFLGLQARVKLNFTLFVCLFLLWNGAQKCYKMAPGKFDNGAQHAIKWCPISYKMVTNVVLARSIAGDLYLRFLWKRFALYTCLFHSQSFQQVYHNIAASVATKGVRKGGGVGINPPPLSLIFYKNFITFARRLSVFAYFLLVNLST